MPSSAASGRRVAIVTGAARGIGAATAQRLADDGRRVVAVDIDGPALRHRWTASDDLLLVEGAVEDASTAAAAVAAAARAGDLDVLVNNAGLPVDRAFTAQQDAQWEAVLGSLLGGTRRMTMAVVRHMQREAEAEMVGGPEARPGPRRIIATVPATTVAGTPGGSASAAAGGAVAALTTTLARELGGWGIRVNAVLVGYVHSRLTAALPDGVDLPDPAHPGLPEPVRQMVAATTALGRLGLPHEVAGVHAFLAGPDADYVTGAIIPVTGGLLGT